MIDLRRFDHWLFDPTDARQVAALRIGLCGILLVRLLQHDFVALSRQPAELYRPLSYMHALSQMPSSGLVRVSLVVAVISTIAAASGFWSRLTLPVATLLSLLLFGMTTSLGKVMHNDALLLLCLVPLAIGTTDNVWSVRSWWRRRRRNVNAPPATGSLVSGSWASGSLVSGWTWRVTVLLVCGAYFFSGLAKLTHSGLEWVFSDNLRWIMYANSDGRVVPNHLAVWIADRVWLSRLSGAGILGLELGFPLVLWRWELRWLMVPGAVTLHVLTWLALGLNYFPMAAAVLVVMIEWPRLVDKIHARLGLS